jgi:hypothetical protein
MIFNVILATIFAGIFIINFGMWLFIVKIMRDILKIVEKSDIIQINKKQN